MAYAPSIVNSLGLKFDINCPWASVNCISPKEK